MRQLHPAIAIVGGSFAALLIIGIAIPKLTVWDLVRVDPMLKRCVEVAVDGRDNPFERIAIHLGKSRIIEVRAGAVFFESFTLFRIPMGILRGQPNEWSAVFCDFAASPRTPVVSGSFLPEPNSITPGWYIHRINETSLLITRQEKLPDIGGTEGYAYGEQVGISLAMTGLTPQEWAGQQQWLDDESLVKAKTWTEMHGHALLQVQHETEASGQLTNFLFVGDKVYTISLYPYPAGDGLDIVNALLKIYAN